MRARFEGDEGRRRLVGTLLTQKAVAGDPNLAAALAERATLVDAAPGEVLIEQGAGDNDLYFLLTGKMSVSVNGKVVAERGPGDHLGEQAAIDPAQPRSANVVAGAPCVLAKVAEPDLAAIAEAHPAIWRNLAKELSKRLVQRNALVRRSNERPVLFVISSKEALPIAQEIQLALSHDMLVVVWPDGVFFASGYPLEALEAALADADFALAIAQPDDVVTIRGKDQPAPRDNVVFELGFFMGHLGRRRTLLLQPANQPLKLPSDLQGLTAINYRVGEKKHLAALLGPACHEIRKTVEQLGVRT